MIRAAARVTVCFIPSMAGAKSFPFVEIEMGSRNGATRTLRERTPRPEHTLALLTLTRRRNPLDVRFHG